MPRALWKRISADHYETPHIRWPDGESWWENFDPSSTGGRVRLVIARNWESSRTTCWCCTCGDYGNTDPYCRNHGYLGTRICGKHPGGGDRLDEDENPLATVQEIRAESGLAHDRARFRTARG